MSTTQRLFPGMCDDSLEIFYHEEDNELMAIHQGSIIKYDDLPESTTQFLAEIIETEEDLKNILNEWFPNNIKEQKRKLAICRFGGLNHEPDYDFATMTVSHDIVDCDIKATCAGCGIVCKNLQYNGIELNEVEIKSIQLMSTDMKNLAIADELNMPQGSFEVHRTKLYQKINVKTKPELTRLGVFLGIC